MSVDKERLAMAWKVVERIYQRTPGTGESLGMEPSYLAHLLDQAIANWLVETSSFRWLFVTTQDFEGVSTVGGLVNVCYNHIARKGGWVDAIA